MPTEAISSLGLAYVPQRENIFDELTVLDNLQLGSRSLPREQRAGRLGRAAGAFPPFWGRPSNAARRPAQRRRTSDAGHRHRLAEAGRRSCCWTSPSAGLAPVVATEVFRVLQALSQQGITLIVVEQNARRILQYCDHAYVLREGTLAFQGTAAQCLEDEETIKGYLGVH